MARATAKTSNVNRATPAALAAGSVTARAYDHDLDDWPRSWMGWEKDLPPGQELVACFRPFIAYLAASDLAPKTIRRHVDNLWRLGGRIITDLNETPKLRKQLVREVLWQAIDDDEGGPLINGGMDEQDQRSFDATCRRLRRFLSQTS
jgi:hypothetical protein